MVAPLRSEGTLRLQGEGAGIVVVGSGVNLGGSGAGGIPWDGSGFVGVANLVGTLIDGRIVDLGAIEAVDHVIRRAGAELGEQRGFPAVDEAVAAMGGQDVDDVGGTDVADVEGSRTVLASDVEGVWLTLLPLSFSRPFWMDWKSMTLE